MSDVARDAERWRALEWADGVHADGSGEDIYDIFEFKPKGYDGGKCNRYYLGTVPGTFAEIADRLVLAMLAERSKLEERHD